MKNTFYKHSELLKHKHQDVFGESHLFWHFTWTNFALLLKVKLSNIL